MSKSKKGFRKRWLLAIPGLAVIALAVLVFPKLKPELELGSCDAGGVLTAAPTADTDFDYLVPLGNIGPPDHTIPTDHIYYVFKRNSPDDPVPVVSVKSPGRVRVTQINRQTATIDGQVRTDDYHLFFSPCRGVSISFDHIHTLAPKLAAAVAHGASCSDTHPRPTDTYRYCNKDADILLMPGEELGTAGGGAAAGFDFGAADSRQPALIYANQKRYGKADHTVCPINLFTEPLKSALMTRFKRTAEPRCGEVAQDKAGTLQGNWYSFMGGSGGVGSWAKSLALVHDNLDPSIGIVSIGGLKGLVLRLPFTPHSVGSLNREFSSVTADSTVYCYQVDNPGGRTAGGGALPPQNNHSVLIQLVSATELRIQAQSGVCGRGPYSLTSATSYYR